MNVGHAQTLAQGGGHRGECCSMKIAKMAFKYIDSTCKGLGTVLVYPVRI